MRGVVRRRFVRVWPTVSIRMSLLRNLVGVIIVLAGAILATTMFSARSAVGEFSRSVTNVSIELTENRLREFFEPVTQQLLVTREWGKDGMLNPDDVPGLCHLLQPVLEQYAQVAGIIIADDTGRECMLMRTPDGFACRQMNISERGAKAHWLEWSDTHPQPVESWREIEGYDPRQRPWFIGAHQRRTAALAASEQPATRELVHWTAPYTFFTVQRPGITTAVTFEDPHSRINVLAFDIELGSISEYTESVHVTEHGGVIVLTQDTRVLGLPRSDHFASPPARQVALLRQPQEIGLPLDDEAYETFRANIGNPDSPPTQFESLGETWWGKAKLFSLGPDQQLLIAVIVPENDMITNLPSLRLWILGVTAAVLVAAILRAIVLARRFSKPIEQLVAQSEDISRGDLDEHPPIESRIAEVGALARAQEHMRTALRSLLKMERDMQLAKQIQQRTFPRTLPTMHGYAIACWANPADDTGGDTYDVIGLSTVEDREPGVGQGEHIVFTNDNPRYTVMILADATGHGIGPALAVSQFRSMVRMAIRLGATFGAFARHVNEQLCADLPSGRFITAWLGMLDREQHILHTFSAGHAPLFHYIAARNECELLDADTMPFGITRQLPLDHRPPIPFGPGDFFIVLSDGILELQNSRGEQFGKARMVEFIKTHRHARPEAWLEALKAELARFAEGAHAMDDITAIVLKRA